MVAIKLLGAVYLEDENGLRDRAATQRHRLALLALLATARKQIVPREKLMALLWPDRDAEHVRKLLNQSIYVLRRALGECALVSAGDALRLDTRLIDCDVINFERAAEKSDLERCVELYGGPFLDGFFLSNAAEFDSWMQKERTRLAACYALALAELGDNAQTSGDHRAALHWRQILASHNLLDSSATLRLMETLEAVGDPAGALQQAENHEKALKAELGIRPPADLISAVARLQGLRTAKSPEPKIALAHPGPAAPADTVIPTQQVVPKEKSPWRSRRLAIVVVIALLTLPVAIQQGWQLSRKTSATATEALDTRTGEEIRKAPVRRPLGDTPLEQSEPGTTSIAALELYRRGNDPALSRNNSAARQAIAYFRQAILLDPDFAAAWAGLARASMRVAAAGEYGADAELYERAEQAASKALEIDSSNAEAYAVLGMLRMYDFDLLAAEPLLQRAVSLEPRRAATHEWLVGLYLWMGKPQVALAHAEQALELDPFSPSATAEFARALIANGRADDALAQLELLLAVDPPLLRVSIIAAQCHAAKAQWQQAIAEIQGGPARTGTFQQALLGYLSARAGDGSTAVRIRDTLYDRWQHGGGGAVLLAIVEAGLDNSEQAVLWLERSLEDDSIAATPDQFTLLHPVMQKLRGNPRFDQLPPFALWIAADAQ